MRCLVRRSIVVTLLTLVAGFASGCLAPTLPPLPPPNAQASAPADGEVVVSGNVLTENAGAMVLALNNRTGDMAGQLLENDETRFSFKMRAEEADLLTVFYLVHNEQSEAIELEVPGAEPAGSGAGSAAPDAGAAAPEQQDP